MVKKRHTQKSRPSSVSSGSGSHGSPTSTPSNHAKERVGKYDLGGLSRSWDDSQDCRERLRAGHNLLQNFDSTNQVNVDGDVDKTLENCMINSFVLLPVMDLLRQNQLMLPALDRLIQCIDAFYRTSKVTRTLEHCYNQAWAIRDLINVLKGLLYRESPPTDAQLDFCPVQILFALKGI